MRELSVKSHQGLNGLEQVAHLIDSLNLASDFPNPFLSSAYLRCSALHNEYNPDPNEIVIYTVWSGDDVIGCLPTRWVREYFGPKFGRIGLSSFRVIFLASLDVDRPGVLCKIEDEQRVCVALLEHLKNEAPKFGMLEFVGQIPGHALYDATHQAADRSYFVRDIDAEPFNEITLVWPDLRSYFRSLSANMRRNVAQYARYLFAEGRVQLVYAQGGPAVSAWLEAYCDLEGRSWKYSTSAAITRNPRRVQFYRELLSGRAEFVPSFIGVVLDGGLIGATLNGSFASADRQTSGVWMFETVYDESFQDLGPGNLLSLLSTERAIHRQEKFSNLLHSFAYYKKRWGATQVNVENVQLIRRGSVHHLRSILGNLKKRLQRDRVIANNETQSPYKAGIKDGAQISSASSSRVRPDRSQASRVTEAALNYQGPGMEILEYEQIKSILPFDATVKTE
jgi:hypothetical protein